MPETTIIEGLPYPCLTDPFQRHWIQDLAESADDVLARIRSDLELAENRPRAQMRRVSGTQSITNNIDVVVNYTLSDYGPTNWNSTSAGTISPSEPGMYYVELTVFPTANTSAGFEAYTLQLQYNGVAQIIRKFPSETGASLDDARKLSGLMFVNAVPAALRGVFRITTTSAITCNIVSARLACTRWIGCATTPLNANPGFETGVITPWQTSSSILTPVRTPGHPAHGGVWSVHVAPSTPAIQFPGIVSGQFAATAGLVYNMKAWIYPTVAESYHVDARWFDNATGGTQIGTSAGTTTALPAGSWTQLSMTATAPVGTLGARLAVIRGTASTPAPPFYVDDAMGALVC